ncbi:hypothetical protein K402DRAFT_463534 [Aulographum hederae CBS 113979]|uniref:BTB domain-containing protein n=1 Tax=Aulographum hederae CBS 113979 TaxID=1176131 RepID=A0A6G1H091_9PEZI|nr:hypothetical protein K402DRAFT_463534 [Aulographum hederae CBS 113979]
MAEIPSESPQQVQVEEPRPDFFNMSFDMVTVKLDSGLEVPIYTDLLTYHSRYFKNMFRGGFLEASSRKTSLAHTSDNTFRAFLNWMQTGVVIQEKDQEADDAAQYRGNLVALGILADTIDCRRLRNDVVTAAVLSYAKHSKNPCASFLKKAIDNLPESSGLLLFLLHRAAVKRSFCSSNKNDVSYEKLPPKYLIRLWKIAKLRLDWITNDPMAALPWAENLCQYHEHETDDEKAACRNPLPLEHRKR